MNAFAEIFPLQVRQMFWRAFKFPKLNKDRADYERFSLIVDKTPRHVGGAFGFHFGVFKYVDAMSLKYQYVEMFLQRGYDFSCESNDPTILDCGGNVGLSVVWFKRRYPQSRVIVFEADPTVAQVLRTNVAGLNLENVEVVEAAVWTRAGTVQFAAEGSDAGCIDEVRGGREVISVRLADYITGPVDLLKMDIEGAEYEVLLDLCHTGKMQQIRRLICEIHGRPSRCDQLHELLSALDRSKFRFTFNHARSAPDLPGEPEPTPFSAASDGKYLLHLYAWRV